MESGEALTIGLQIMATASDIEARARLIHPLLAIARSLPDQDTAQGLSPPAPPPSAAPGAAAPKLPKEDSASHTLPDQAADARPLPPHDPAAPSSADHDESPRSLPVQDAARHSPPHQDTAPNSLHGEDEQRSSLLGQTAEVGSLPDQAAPSLDTLPDQERRPGTLRDLTGTGSSRSDSRLPQGLPSKEGLPLPPGARQGVAAVPLPLAPSTASQGGDTPGVDKQGVIRRLEDAARGLEALQVVPQPWQGRLAHLASFPFHLAESLIMALQFGALYRIRDKSLDLFPDSLLLLYARYAHRSSRHSRPQCVFFSSPTSLGILPIITHLEST